MVPITEMIFDWHKFSTKVHTTEGDGDNNILRRVCVCGGGGFAPHCQDKTTCAPSN